MTLVSNTSPLCYLALIGHAEILPKLYGNVHTTQKVLENHHINVYVTQAGALKRFLICWERLEHYIIGHLILMKGSSRLSLQIGQTFPISLSREEAGFLISA